MTSGRKAILVISFGTSYNTTRERTIGAIEQAVAEAFPDYEMRRAFTSQKIINKLRKRDGEVVDNVKEAMERLLADEIETLVIQPTHVMSGYEYEDMMEELEPYRTHFASFACGKPLLSDDGDYEAMAKILTEETAGYRGEKTAILYMGHGTGHTANEVYEKLENRLRACGYEDDYIGTVEGTPSLDEVAETLGRGEYDRVALFPLMIVAGDHACNDMAGDDEDSWKMVLASKGYLVTCVLKGLGEYAGVQKLFAEHAKMAMKEQETTIS